MPEICPQCKSNYNCQTFMTYLPATGGYYCSSCMYGLSKSTKEKQMEYNKNNSYSSSNYTSSYSSTTTSTNNYNYSSGNSNYSSNYNSNYDTNSYNNDNDNYNYSNSYYSNGVSNSYNNNNNNNDECKDGCLDNKTIAMAKESGAYTDAQIKWMEKSKNSGKLYNTLAHRGIQTYLNKNFDENGNSFTNQDINDGYAQSCGYKSKNYSKNTNRIKYNYGLCQEPNEDKNQRIIDNEFRHLYDDPNQIPSHYDDYDNQDVNDGYAEWNESYGWNIE